MASDWNGLDVDQVKVHREGNDITFVTYGRIVDNVMAAAKQLEMAGIEATVLRLLSVSDIPAGEIVAKMSKNQKIIVIEEACSGSGIVEALSYEVRRLCCNCSVRGMDLGRGFVPQGSLEELYMHCGLDEESIVHRAKEVLSE